MFIYGFNSEEFSPDRYYRQDMFGNIRFYGLEQDYSPSGPNLAYTMYVNGDDVDSGTALIMGDEPEPGDYDTQEEYDYLCTENFYDEMNMVYESWCRNALIRYVDWLKAGSRRNERRTQELSALVNDMQNREVYRCSSTASTPIPSASIMRRGRTCSSAGASAAQG